MGQPVPSLAQRIGPTPAAGSSPRSKKYRPYLPTQRGYALLTQCPRLARVESIVAAGRVRNTLPRGSGPLCLFSSHGHSCSKILKEAA